MPWCDGCDRFLNPNTLRSDGTCPTCERKVAEQTLGTEHRHSVAAGSAASPVTPGVSGAAASAAAEARAPWHFKLLVVLTVLYLAWRLVQLVAVGL